MKAYKGTFTANTATGNQTVSGIVDENAASFTPVAVLLWTNNATANVTFADGFTYAFGLTDGTTSGSGSLVSQDNVAAPQTASRVDTVMACMNGPTATTATRSGAFVSFSSGQFVINWTVQDGIAGIWHYLALGDCDVVAASTAMNMARSAVAATFIPMAWLQFAASSDSTDGPFQGSLAGRRSSGQMDNGAWRLFIDDNVTALTNRYQRGDMSGILATSTATISAIGSLDALGMAWDTATTTGALTQKSLVLGGLKAAGAAGLQPTSTGNQAVTGLGFAPKCVLIFSIGNTAISNKTVANDAKLSMGAADRTRQGMGFAASTNAANPSVAVTYSDTGHIIASVTPNATAGSSTIDAQASITLDSDGFTLNWGTADATQRQYYWLALGDEDAVATAEVAYPFVGAMG